MTGGQLAASGASGPRGGSTLQGQVMFPLPCSPASQAPAALGPSQHLPAAGITECALGSQVPCLAFGLEDRDASYYSV